MRVIFSRAVPQVQPVFSCKKSYERDCESLESRHLRTKLRFKREVRKGEGNVRISLRITQERADATCCGCFKASGCLHPHCDREIQTEAKKYTCLLQICGSITFAF